MKSLLRYRSSATRFAGALALLSASVIAALSAQAAPASNAADTNLVCMTVCRAVNPSLERGHGDGSCVAYVFLGTIAGPHFGDYEAGFRFAQLGYELIE